MNVNWYQAESTKKSVRQIVVEIPPGNERDSKFGMMFFAAKYLHLMTSTWVAGFFRMDGDPGPYVLVRGDREAGKLRGSPLRVAFSFYRMKAGGLAAIFVEADSAAVRHRIKAPHILFEMFYGLDLDETRRLVSDALRRDMLHLCFAEGDGPGQMSDGVYSGAAINAQHDVVVPLLSECRAALQSEWEQLLYYHRSVPAGRRSFEASLQQMQAENPASENTVLQRTKSITETSAKVTTRSTLKRDEFEFCANCGEHVVFSNLVCPNCKAAKAVTASPQAIARHTKKCTHCGREYPEEATVCALDQRALVHFTPPSPDAITVIQSPAAQTTPSAAATSPGAAGVLLLLAGPCALGLTTMDPTNPSLAGLFTLVFAWGGFVYSFMHRRRAALICAWIVIVLTGASAFMTFAGGQRRLEMGELMFAMLIRGGVSFLLSAWAVWNLRQKRSPEL